MRLIRITAASTAAGLLLLAAATLAAAAPSVTAISPNNGTQNGGTSVTLTGTGFASGATVKFGGTSATSVVVNSPTTITATSPSGSGLVDITVTSAGNTSSTSGADHYAYDAPAAESWLGLNGDSTHWTGAANEFSALGIAYDRSFDLTAGAPHSKAEEEGLKAALKLDAEDHMTPVSVIEYEGYEGEFGNERGGHPVFPHESATIASYVEGFVKTALTLDAIAKEVEHEGLSLSPILFEVMNEPWGYTIPRFNGGEYGHVISKLLPEAEKAGLPLGNIYMAGVGENCKEESGKCPYTEKTSGGKTEYIASYVTNEWVSAIYRSASTEAERSLLESKIGGWYFHPYGSATGIEEYDNGGINSLPVVQSKMHSGQNNIVVSEIGFCAVSISHCYGNPQFSLATEAGQNLAESLEAALPYWQEGWLRGLIAYSRTDSGWAMQLENGLLTADGQSLDELALALHAPVFSSQFSGSGANKLSAPYEIGLDGSGDVWVPDAGHDRIEEFSPSGESTLLTFGEEGTRNGQFRVPAAVAVSPTNGDVYVADMGNSRVQQFSPSGSFIRAWGSHGYGEGLFEYPDGIAIDPSGNIWVANGLTGGIEEFNSEGTYLKRIGSGGVGGLTWSAGNLYGATGSSKITEFSPSGTVMREWGTSGSGNGEFHELVGVGSNPVNGDILAADRGNHRIQVFSPTGAFITKFGTKGKEAGQFEEPLSATANLKGEIYVSDETNDTIEKWAP